MTGNKIVIAGLDPRIEWRVNMYLRTMGEIHRDSEKKVSAVFPDIFFDENELPHATRGSKLNLAVIDIEEFNEAHLECYQRAHRVFMAHNAPYQFFVKNPETTTGRDVESVRRLLELKRPLPKDWEYYDHYKKDEKMMPVPGSMFALLEKQLNEHIWRPIGQVREETPRKPHVRVGTFGHSVPIWPIYH